MQNDWLHEWPSELRSVLNKVAEELQYDSIHLAKELSGASGAFTCLARPEMKAVSTNDLILKIGPKFILSADLAGIDRARKIFEGANYPISGAIEHGGLCCIPMVIAGGIHGQTFQQYYIEATNPDEIVELVKELFETVLKKGNVINEAGQSVFDLYRFDDPTVMHRELLDVGDERPTLISRWEEARKQWPGKSYKLMSHGDLHSNNIIVSKKSPYVIDFGRTDMLHTMIDIAKFEREIRLFLYLNNSSDPVKDSHKLGRALEHSTGESEDETSTKLEKAASVIRYLRELARRSVPDRLDWEFEYYSALLAQFIFAAGNVNLRNRKIRKLALRSAFDLMHSLEEKFLEHRIDLAANNSKEQVEQSRKIFLSKLAYTLLRLDQLPSGGWGRTLPQWMERVWEGDHDLNIPRTVDMRTRGGTDFTSYAFYHYYHFTKRLVLKPSDELLSTNNIASKVKENMSSRIGAEGGMGTEQVSKGGLTTSRRVRHTAMGLVTFLIFGKPRGAPLATEELELGANYLLENLSKWREDRSYLFGMYAVLIKLLELLEEDKDEGQLYGTLRASLRDRLLKVLPEICKTLHAAATSYTPIPENTCSSPCFPAPFFEAYHKFWRMERANFLMYFPYLVTNDGNNISVDKRLRERCIKCFEELLEDIAVPFDTVSPMSSLVKYHRNPTPEHSSEDQVSRDWGLSAELSAILEIPAVQEMWASGTTYVREKREAMHLALLHTFDTYHTYPTIFKFTQGVSFSRYLALIGQEELSMSELHQLDEEIDKVISNGLTERGIHDLLNTQFDPREVDSRAIKDMLVDKLESGEFTLEGHIPMPEAWHDIVDETINTSTISFYDDKVSGPRYTKRYLPEPIERFVFRIDDETQVSRYDGKKALDVGCGPGQYAKLLMGKGFHVELVDTSRQMLETSGHHLGIPPPAPRNIYSLDRDFENQFETFDLVFACAMMVHVPRNRSPSVYRSFFRLLKPGGILFVNFKIGDHSLISPDGRFFEYYRDQKIPHAMLKSAGFQVIEVTLRWNRRNMYNDPKEIHWANFYCKKPEPVVEG